MWPHFVHRSVQCSSPSRPGMIRCTTSWVPHSGQSGSAVAANAVELASESGMGKAHFQIRLAGGNLQFGLEHLPGILLELELVDLNLGIGDGGIGIRPREADFERRKRNAVTSYGRQY